MEDKTERKIAHLAMTQAVIARMASNSFTLKTLSITLVAGIIALLGAIQRPSPLYVWAGILPVLVFWWLDAKYLQLERLYRALYDEVRHDRELEPYDMRVDRYKQSVQSVPRIALSWSVNAIYSTLLAALAVVAIGVWLSS